MDQFDHYEQNPRKVREKNVYLLHLDNARIVLVVAALIGIIVASFLIGMNFMKDDGRIGSSFAENDLITGQKNLDILNGTIPELPESDELSKPLEEKIGILEEENNAGRDLLAGNEDKESDILTKENIREVTPAARESERKNTPEKTSPARTVNKAVQPKTVKKSAKEPVKVVEVVDRPKPAVRPSGPAYAIQIASYDSRSRAQSELDRLKGMRFNGYIDSSTVNGSRYYRVRIGPVSSKSKALDTLFRVQDISRYENSYMVKE